jgi:hypothetical protein
MRAARASAPLLGKALAPVTAENVAPRDLRPPDRDSEQSNVTPLRSGSRKLLSRRCGVER